MQSAFTTELFGFIESQIGQARQRVNRQREAEVKRSQATRPGPKRR